MRTNIQRHGLGLLMLMAFTACGAEVDDRRSDGSSGQSSSSQGSSVDLREPLQPLSPLCQRQGTSRNSNGTANRAGSTTCTQAGAGSAPTASQEPETPPTAEYDCDGPILTRDQSAYCGSR